MTTIASRHSRRDRHATLLLSLLMAGTLAACDTKDNPDDDGSTPLPPTVTLAAAPTSLTLGTATALTWSSTNATACTASGAWTDSRAVSGTSSVTPAATGDISYTLTCTGPGGSTNATATVTVHPLPTVTLDAAPVSLTLGGSTTLTWASSNTTACVASGGWSGARAVSGVESLTPPAAGESRYMLACTGSGGTATATAVVQVSAAPTVSVTFAGKLTSAGNSSGGPTADGEVADALIQVLVNGSEFTGSTDIDGNYSVTASVPEGITEDVSVLIVGRRVPPSGPEIYFLSQLGSFEQARVRAGADSVLTASEDFRVNVTPFTTAEVALQQELTRGVIDLGISGSPGISSPRAVKRAAPAARPIQPSHVDTPLDQAIDSLRMSIDYEQVLGAATTISLVADRGVPAPFAVADTYSLAYYRDVRLFFIEDQQINNAAAYEAALADTLANRDTTRGVAAAEVPLQAVSAVVGDVSEEALIGNGGSSNDAKQFRFEPAGSGTYSAFTLRSNDVRWTVNATGVIEVRFGTAPSTTFETGIDDGSGNFIFGSCAESTAEIDIQPISSNVARQRVRTVRDCDDGLESLEFALDTTTTVLFTSLDALPASTREDFAGRSFAIEVPSLIPLAGFGDPTELAGDRLNFNADGTGTTFLTGLTFSWQVDAEGALVIQFSNGARSAIRVLRSLFDGGKLVLLANTIDTGTYTLGRPMFEINDGLRFTPASVAGVHYQHGVGTVPRLENVVVGDSARPATLSESFLLKGFAIELFPSGFFNQVTDRLVTATATGSVVRSTLGSAPDIDQGRVWAVRTDGSLLLNSYFRVPFSSGAGCTIESPDPDCYISSQREVFPIFLHGDRQGWLERRVFNEASEPGPVVGTPTFLIRTYNQAPNGDFALPRTDSFAPVRAGPKAARPPLRPEVSQAIRQERSVTAAIARGDRKAAQINRLHRPQP